MLAAHRVLPQVIAASPSAFTLRGVNHGAAATTLTLPVTTNAGDCIIIAFCAGGTTAESGSGAGATWTNYNFGSAPTVRLSVGANCSAGQTTCGFGTSGGSIVVSVWSGVAATTPVQQTQIGTGSSATVTTPTLTYTAGSLLIAASVDYGNTPPPTITWSNGKVNTNVGWSNTDTSHPISLDYAIGTGSTSTTCTDQWATVQTNNLLIAALSPA